MSGSILFLHGPSSSGKSTIAQAIVAQAPAPVWHLSLDHLRDGGILPMDRFRSGALEWRDAVPGVFDGLHRMVAAVADAGNDVVFEHIIEDAAWVPELVRMFAPYDVVFVGVRCALPILEAREVARGDRRIGSAKEDFHAVHEGRLYDLELDGTQDVAENARTVLAYWQGRLRRSEFVGAAQRGD